MSIKYEDDRNRLEIKYIQEVKLVDELQNKKIIDDNNSIKLNNLEPEQLSTIMNKVREGIANKTEKISQDIKLDDINTILKNVGVINERIELGNLEISDAEKNRFNSNFEILQGENLKAEDVLNIINAIKENASDLQVVSNKELKIEISRNSSNEQLVKTLEEFIEKDKNRNYNVKLEYDNENGLVKFVILTILEKNR